MLLPLLPTLPNDSSPYATRSAFGLNPLFIDLSRVPCFSESGGLESLSASDRERLTEARESARVRYDLVVPLKNSVLRSTFKRFDAVHWRPQTPLAKEFLDYCQREAWWLSDFSLFAAISESQAYRAWWQWPEALRSRVPGALDSERARLSDSVLFERWKQWIAESQWQQVRQQAKNRGIFLCGDEPFIVAQGAWTRDWESLQMTLRQPARIGDCPISISRRCKRMDFAGCERALRKVPPTSTFAAWTTRWATSDNGFEMRKPRPGGSFHRRKRANATSAGSCFNCFPNPRESSPRIWG